MRADRSRVALLVGALVLLHTPVAVVLLPFRASAFGLVGLLVA